LSNNDHELRRIEKEEVGRAADTLVEAFQDDPVWNAIFSDYEEERDRVRAAYEVPLRYCMKYGSVYATSSFEGAAAWAPERYADISLLRGIISGSMRSGMRVGMKVGMKIKPIFSPIEKDRRAFMKGRAFLYPLVIGVAKKHQGKGHGGRLVRALLAEADRNGVAVYLETESEENVAFYEKYGFKLIQQITLPVVDLPMWEMIREAKS
jgi:ribosomal protein S18 acetylase RimI-like enzyme